MRLNLGEGEAILSVENTKGRDVDESATGPTTVAHLIGIKSIL